jgi:hypothetical protein
MAACGGIMVVASVVLRHGVTACSATAASGAAIVAAAAHHCLNASLRRHRGCPCRTGGSLRTCSSKVSVCMFFSEGRLGERQGVSSNKFASALEADRVNLTHGGMGTCMPISSNRKRFQHVGQHRGRGRIVLQAARLWEVNAHSGRACDRSCTAWRQSKIAGLPGLHASGQRS